jgi:hypothetical protein
MTDSHRDMEKTPTSSDSCPFYVPNIKHEAIVQEKTCAAAATLVNFTSIRETQFSVRDARDSVTLTLQSTLYHEPCPLPL